MQQCVDIFSKYDFAIKKKLVIFIKSRGRMCLSRIFYLFSQIVERWVFQLDEVTLMRKKLLIKIINMLNKIILN